VYDVYEPEGTPSYSTYPASPPRSYYSERYAWSFPEAPQAARFLSSRKTTDRFRSHMHLGFALEYIQEAPSLPQNGTDTFEHGTNITPRSFKLQHQLELWVPIVGVANVLVVFATGLVSVDLGHVEDIAQYREPCKY